MKKLSVVLIVFVLMAFTTDRIEKNDVENKEVTLKIQKNISEFQEIITQKQLEAKSLQVKAKEISENNIEVSIRMVEQANLLRMNCLKYEAVIACMQRHLE